MATCKDCLHFIVCEKACHLFDEQDVEKRCKHFKNKADFVEVVRCKDCKWWHNEIDCRNTSGLYRFVPNGNWFCASGERRRDSSTAGKPSAQNDRKEV